MLNRKTQKLPFAHHFYSIAVQLCNSKSMTTLEQLCWNSVLHVNYVEATEDSLPNSSTRNLCIERLLRQS